jgi:hypothetical protein
MDFEIAVDIAAAPALAWSVMADVERWPEWTASISRVKKLSPGPLQVGSRVRIHQPKFPPAVWHVTGLVPGAEFSWVSSAPGIWVTARHSVEAVATGCRVKLSIGYEGFLGVLLARWTRHLIQRYLAMEADGLKARCADQMGVPIHKDI